MEKLIQGYNRSVAITGIGMVCPLGLDTPSTWQALISGRSGVGPITRFDASRFETRIAGEVKGFDPAAFMSPREARRMDRFAQLAVAAAGQALTQSGLKVDDSSARRIGVTLGSGLGGVDTFYEQARVLMEKGPDRLSPFTMPMMTLDMAAAQVSIMLGLKGPNFVVSSACSSGTDAVGLAFELIRTGEMDAIMAGGTDAGVHPICVAGYSALKALSTRNESPESASRPFDATRDGFIISEGSAVLVLESLEHALSRGAKVIAEVAGYSATSDANHITHPSENGEGGIRVIRQALASAGAAPEDIDYINAHGTSTPINDRMESAAVKSVFGQHAYRIPISSTKSMTGHLIGAAGALEAAICALVIQQGIIPPTINLTHPDPDCDLDYVPDKARKAEVNATLSNSFGFGGRNSALVLRRFGDDVGI
jgi:3-oxoacyl-[acyl-carrier-protein] synthase II